MPGIFGLASAPPVVGTAALLAAMAARLRHHAWYQESRHLDEAAGVALGRTALGTVNAAAQPAANEDGSLLAVMDGEIHDYPEQRRALEAAGHTFRGHSHAELLLHGYEARGQAFFRGLRGKFVAALWDARKRRLILTNDRFGMRPLYYVKLPGRLLFASEIKALLADPEVSRRGDLRGIAQFFTFGHLLGEDTLLEAVRVLPAAGWLTYDLREDRLTPGCYGGLPAGPGEDGVARSQVLDRLDQAFADAVARCASGTDRLGLSLSGGLDARTILAVLPPDRPVTTVSIGMDGSMDHAAAAEMARLTGRTHHRCLL